MSDLPPTDEKALAALQERAKELTCLLSVEELLHDTERPLEEVFRGVIEAIPPGWQHPELCRTRITYEGHDWQSPDFIESPWGQCARILVQERAVGSICVHYIAEPPVAEDGPFLEGEVRLVSTIADRLGNYLRQRSLERLLLEFSRDEARESERRLAAWRGGLELVRQTDQNLYIRLARKMVNFLCWSGVREAQDLVERHAGGDNGDVEGLDNYPCRKLSLAPDFYRGTEPFELASRYLGDDEIFSRIQRWMFEDRAKFLVKVLESQQSSLGEIADALRRYQQLVPEDSSLSRATLEAMKASLINRFLTEQLEFIKVAKQHVDVGAFLDLLDRMIFPATSHGKLGGKSAGLFLATQILRRAAASLPGGAEIKTPRSWYIASDALLAFMEFNDLDDVIQHKYKEIDQVRLEYPHLVQLYKNARFPPELAKGLSVALDDFGDRPLIVRSSSLLEDRLGTAFSGKYKSLFLANQGTKQQRLDALLDAVAEIYASVFGPDPIEYRRDRGLLDFQEEMGVLIQEVVGTRLGRYFLPAFAGVAFSRNEFRWSPRIRREDGLIRLVPGLGTRAVDRVSDDFPVLLAPGQPRLRANASVDETVRYSPKRIDVINLETNAFETLELPDLLAECGADYPALAQVFSVVRDDRLHKPVGLLLDPSREQLAATFEGLISDSPFVSRLHAMLRQLEQSLGTPVDVEFASDGRDFYLLQCRPQSHAEDSVASAIPKDVPRDQVLFTARRYVSNGFVPDITHVVYVDPRRYAELEDQQEMVAVGRAVGKLNKLLPKRQFVLIGPGRWGSRGDIKLGVSVGYSDINNTAVLIEVARRKGNYVPELSFGTHFFQDLVESSIRYLPLYPDDEGILFNERFLLGAPNVLAEVLPEHATLADVLRVIDVPAATGGNILRVLMNADLDEAIALLAEPGAREPGRATTELAVRRGEDDHWRWRYQMAEHIAAELDPVRFGVVAVYVFGSTKNATAGPGSDIDLLVHVRGGDVRREALVNWLDGWSLCLAEMNYRRCGYRTDRLLDVHIITDDDIARRDSFAIKIGAITDAARPLQLGGRVAAPIP
ncbi:MAG: nucleotidyltransferase domain-containing protein [Deltaproteobacteria bacterium]|nr:nucleotidyltransferase domain-containing protein [Deltaproteobacteria bacterium]